MPRLSPAVDGEAAPTAGPGEPWPRSVDRLQWLFWAAAVFLAPWIVLLYDEQKPQALAHDVHLLAAGLIVAMLVAMVVTAVSSGRGRPVAVVAASLTAVATGIAAWFRLLTRTGGVPWVGTTPVFVALVVVVIAVCTAVMVRELASRSGPLPAFGWVSVVLAVAAAALVVPLVVTFTEEPQVEVARHLIVAWCGLDVAEAVSLALTGWAIHRRSPWVVVAATAAGTLLLCDAWINIVSSAGVARKEAVVMGFAEIPLAALSYWVAVRTTRLVFHLRPPSGVPA